MAVQGSPIGPAFRPRLQANSTRDNPNGTFFGFSKFLANCGTSRSGSPGLQIAWQGNC